LRLARLPALALSLSPVVACGPVEYMRRVSGGASAALASAEADAAAVHARYEYTKAVEYLRKAREEAGESSFAWAIEYGRRAEELATRARELARGRAGAGQP
jgi:hypothetical protein